MIAHPFHYCCPATMHEATQAVAEGADDAAILAGGTWLVPHMSRAERRPRLVVDLRRLGLDGIRLDGGQVVLGACTTYDQLKSLALVQDALPVLAIMAHGITGGAGITGQGTIGGAACYGSPSSDVPACLLALRARLRLTCSDGVRDVPAAEFFTGPFQTARRSGEILSAILFERPQGRARAGYHKLKLSGSSWPIVTASCCLDDCGSAGVHAHVAIGAAGVVPSAASVHLAAADPAALHALGQGAVAAIGQGWADELADAGYRLDVAPEIARRAVAAALRALHD